MTKIQRGNASYWIEAVAEGGEDYYTKPGEAPGEWLGELATELGLSGQVDRDSYIAALAGIDPASGDQLIRRPSPRRYVDSMGRERVAEPVLGYDVRFAAPKSVSLLYGIGEPALRAAILAAHDEAVAEGIAYLESEACFVQRGRNGTRIEPGAGLIGMGFRHRMSRAGDPALHTHVVIPNTTRATSDDSWLTLASPKGRSPFYLHAKAAGYVYQAALRRAIARELGLEWGPLRNGHADIAAIERGVIEHFSQRRTEIEAAMERYGASSAKVAEVAAYRTREAKDYGIDLDERRGEWIARAEEFELTPAWIGELVAQRGPREARPIAPTDLDAALARLEESRSHFDRRDLLCALADQLRDGADAHSLLAGVEALIASERVLEIHPSADPLAPAYYTTPRLWELEQGFIEAARKGQSAGAAVVDRRTLAVVLERHRYLGEDQREMVTRLLTGGERILAVAALPGTGKTTALSAAREAWEAAGHPVIGVATARSASGELSDAGVPASSIAALLIRSEELRGKGLAPLEPGTVVFMDEASTTSTPHAAELAELVSGCEGKLVAIGDPRQIGAVGPGGLYGHLTKTIEPSVLTEIRRQRAEVDREIVRLAHEGRGSDALDLLRVEGRLLIADTHSEALAAMALDWHSSYGRGNDAVMIARRNRDVSELNEIGRELLREDGRLGSTEVEIAGAAFASGDRVITRVNTPSISNRERWEVIAVHPDKGEIGLRRTGGDERAVVLGAEYLGRRTPAGEPSLQHAYAMSAYATESKTFDESFALIDAGASREEFLVSVSRSRGPTVAYGVAASELTDPELGPGLRRIEDSAHELRAAAERPAHEFAALEVSQRERLARLPEVELMARRLEFERRVSGEVRPSPNSRRLASVEERIAEAEQQLAIAAARREEALAQRRPDRGRLARLESEHSLGEQLLGGLRTEREQLLASLRVEGPLPSAPSPEQRLEHSLVLERLTQLRRRQIAAERIEPSSMVEQALGERPSDPRQAALWNEGVHAIYAYRHRHGIGARDPHPLGPEPPAGSTRTDWLAANRHLLEIQTGLGISGAPERSIERDISIEL